jgi:virginiamycin B lyase
MPMTLRSTTAALAIGALVAACRAQAPEAAARPQGAAPADTSTALVSADWLATLPEGEEKRWLVLQCTGCHAIDDTILMVDGSPRTRASWVESIRRMMAFSGADTDFPILSRSLDPEAMTDFLVEHAPTAIPAARPIPMSAQWEVREYPLPADDVPHDVAIDSAGRVIVTGMATHRMYVLDPGSAAFREVAIPVENANPRAVEIGPGGEWWVVLGYPEKLARYEPDTEAWSTWDLGVYPHEIALDADGRVWFNGHFTRDPEILGYFDPATEEIRAFEIPFGPLADGGSTIPYGLRVDAAGKVWMTQLFGNRLVELDPATGELAGHVLPQPESGPRRHDVGPDGRIWIPAFARGAIAAFDPATGAFDEFPFPLPDALPYVARVDPRSGAVWVGTGAAGVVARLDPATRAFELVPLPSRAPLLRHLAIDPRTGDVWGAASAFPPRGPLVFSVAPRPPWR